MATLTSSKKYNFVSEPDDALVCAICLEVAEDPWQHGKCGRLLCKECLEKLGRNKPCPNCRMAQPQYFEDNRSKLAQIIVVRTFIRYFLGKRDIKALCVKCANVGCEWEGTVGTLEQHVATCEFAVVPCPKECKDENNGVQHFMRKDLASHLESTCSNRDYQCQHCEEKGTYASITQDHDKVCKKKIFPCPNAGCSEEMQRQHLDKHVRNECAPH